MISTRINKLIICIMLMAFAGSLFAGTILSACEYVSAKNSECACSSMTSCGSSETMSATTCMNMTASSKCGCSISDAPDPEETPMVVPEATHMHGFDDFIVLPFYVGSTDIPQQIWAITPIQITYDFLYSSYTSDRAPPYSTHII
ncbi:MAG: hypothetical protein ACYC0V_03810 [Armatimonadota bacterium]